MELQRERARAASKFGVDLRGGEGIDARSEFIGYDTLQDDSTIAALRRDGARVETLQPGESGEVVLARTPFYAEAGGQVGDTGLIVTEKNGTGSGGASFAVTDTQKVGSAIVHIGSLKGAALKVGDAVITRVDAERRAAIRLNHSATHLLHAALRQVLGTHVTQAGSLVAPDHLRFDFSHLAGIKDPELEHIESLVNEQVQANIVVSPAEMDLEAALQSGAMALFGEKYGDRVRVIRIGDFSTELCGGTHLGATGEIGLFKVVGQGAVASGVRRIEAGARGGAL